jgi:hypothetical protein
MNAFYKRLIEQGTAKKVALVAVARKPVIATKTLISEDRP